MLTSNLHIVRFLTLDFPVSSNCHVFRVRFRTEGFAFFVKEGSRSEGRLTSLVDDQKLPLRCCVEAREEEKEGISELICDTGTFRSAITWTAKWVISYDERHNHRSRRTWTRQIFSLPNDVPFSTSIHAPSIRNESRMLEQPSRIWKGQSGEQQGVGHGEQTSACLCKTLFDVLAPWALRDVGCFLALLASCHTVRCGRVLGFGLCRAGRLATPKTCTIRLSHKSCDVELIVRRCLSKACLHLYSHRWSLQQKSQCWEQQNNLNLSIWVARACQDLVYEKFWPVTAN